MKLAMMHIFLKNHQIETYQRLAEDLKRLESFKAKEISLSPMREDGPYAELYVTLKVDESYVEQMLAFISSDWDGRLDDCMCYSATAKIFNSDIDSLYFQIPD